MKHMVVSAVMLLINSSLYARARPVNLPGEGCSTGFRICEVTSSNRRTQCIRKDQLRMTSASARVTT